MPYSVPGGALLQITIEGYLHGQQVMTVLTYKRASSDVLPDAGASIQGYADEFVATDVYASWKSCVATAVGGIRVYAQWISPGRYAYKAAAMGFETGEAVGTCSFPNVASVVTRRADEAGRDGISNLHLPGLVDEDAIAGIVAAGQLTRLGNFAEFSVQPIEDGLGDSAIPVAYHRAAPNLSKPLTTAYAQDTTRVMRRRTVGLGA